MSPVVDIQCATAEPIPGEADPRQWVDATLHYCQHTGDTEVSIRLVDSAEMAALNQTYRGKWGDTNVLSFPSSLPEELGLPLLGDIAICAPVVAREATEQGKNSTAHWAHMTVHGTLHLLGYDHIDDAEATIMETLEAEILAVLNFPSPYADDAPQECASP